MTAIQLTVSYNTNPQMALRNFLTFLTFINFVWADIIEDQNHIGPAWKFHPSKLGNYSNFAIASDGGSDLCPRIGK